MDSRTKYVIKHSGPMGSKTQQNTAAAYYARKNVPTSGIPAGKMDVNHVSNFAGIMAKCPPPAPSQLLKKLNEEYPNETIIVLDATTGQNAIKQIEEFNKYSKIKHSRYDNLDI